jgi:hypothetical protein
MTKREEPLFDWGSVDWLRRDIDIAAELGCSRERVRQVRKRLKAYPVGRDVGKHDVWQSIDWSKTSRQIADEIGYHCCTVMTKRRELGLPVSVKTIEERVRSERVLKLIELTRANANLRLIDLARQVGYPNVSTVAGLVKKHNLPYRRRSGEHRVGEHDVHSVRVVSAQEVLGELREERL